MIAHFPGLLHAQIGGVKLVTHVSKKSILTYNRANSFIIKNAIILNTIHTQFNMSDTEVVIRILLVLIKTADDLNHSLNIR